MQIKVSKWWWNI